MIPNIHVRVTTEMTPIPVVKFRSNFKFNRIHLTRFLDSLYQSSVNENYLFSNRKLSIFVEQWRWEFISKYCYWDGRHVNLNRKALTPVSQTQQKLNISKSSISYNNPGYDLNTIQTTLPPSPKYSYLRLCSFVPGNIPIQFSSFITTKNMLPCDNVSMKTYW